MLLLQQIAQYDNVFVWAIYTKALILLYKVPRLSNSVYSTMGQSPSKCPIWSPVVKHNLFQTIQTNVMKNAKWKWSWSSIKKMQIQ